jgi:hypothetical protein
MIAVLSDQIPARLVRDKQLQVVDVPTALFKWNNGMAVNLKELAVVTGYDYASVRRWYVPLFAGKITKSEFESWKRSKKIERVDNQVATTESAFCVDQTIGAATAALSRRRAAAKFSLRREATGK